MLRRVWNRLYHPVWNSVLNRFLTIRFNPDSYCENRFAFKTGATGCSNRFDINKIIIEEWNYNHQNRLIETSRMVVVSSSCDHWMLRYLVKCHNSALSFAFAVPLDVFPNISASSGHRKTKLLPFDSSWWDDSNGYSLILLLSLDAKIFNKT